MATTEFQQKLAQEVFERLQNMNAANEFEPRRYSRILYPLLAREEVLREAWPYHWRRIKPLVQGRIYRLNQARMREFARNDPNLEDVHQEISVEEMIREATNLANQRGDHLIPDL